MERPLQKPSREDSFTNVPMKREKYAFGVEKYIST
nr:MAG TPA: hypothetical protein [Caudoviricetes sp.]